MKEEIVWHEYPETNPKNAISEYLVTRTNGIINWSASLVWYGEGWIIPDEIVRDVLPLDSFPVIAWAEMPKGIDATP